VAFIVMCLKVPIYMGGLTSLRNRGGEIAWGSQGFTPAGKTVERFTTDASVDAGWYGRRRRPDPRQRERTGAPRPFPSWSVRGRRLPPWRRRRERAPSAHYPRRLHLHRLDASASPPPPRCWTAPHLIHTESVIAQDLIIQCMTLHTI
jgi:hypothetical protein